MRLQIFIIVLCLLFQLSTVCSAQVNATVPTGASNSSEPIDEERLLALQDNDDAQPILLTEKNDTVSNVTDNGTPSLSEADTLNTVPPASSENDLNVSRSSDDNQKATFTPVKVLIKHEGKDAIGMQLALKVKERFSISPLFDITIGDEKVLTLQVKSLSEFDGRPQIGSACCLVWSYQESKDNLAYYLDSSILVLSSDDTAILAETIVAQTDKIVEKFRYLFE